MSSTTPATIATKVPTAVSSEMRSAYSISVSCMDTGYIFALAGQLLPVTRPDARLPRPCLPISRNGSNAIQKRAHPDREQRGGIRIIGRERVVGEIVLIAG